MLLTGETELPVLMSLRPHEISYGPNKPELYLK